MFPLLSSLDTSARFLEFKERSSWYAHWETRLYSVILTNDRHQQRTEAGWENGGIGEGEKRAEKGLKSVRTKRFVSENGSEVNSKNPAFLPANSVLPAVETRSAEPAEAQARHCSRQSLALRCAPLGRLSAGPPVGGNTPLPTRETLLALTSSKRWPMAGRRWGVPALIAAPRTF